jgi:hypothetical protein
MATKIGSLIIRLAVEHGILQEGLAHSERDLAKTTKAIERKAREIADFGKKLALGVAVPMATIARASIDGAIAQRQALTPLIRPAPDQVVMIGYQKELMRSLSDRIFRSQPLQFGVIEGGKGGASVIPITVAMHRSADRAEGKGFADG